MRRGLYALGAVAAILVLAAWLAFNSLDVLVKWTLEHYGPDVTGTAVQVAGVDISPRTGEGRIRGLELANPPGYSAARALRLGEVRLSLDPATLLKDVVHVRELVIDAPQITYERGSKATNLDAIQDRIAAYAKGREAEASAAPAGAKPRDQRRRFVIDRLVIRAGRVTMTTAGLRGQGIGFDLPDIELLDVGKRRGGLTASEVAEVVASTLQQRIAQKLLTNIDALRRGGVEGALDALEGLLK
jgi:uncharacterized protein involved in outer membrane biogenesis